MIKKIVVISIVAVVVIATGITLATFMNRSSKQESSGSTATSTVRSADSQASAANQSASCGQKGGTCTVAEISSRNSKSSCWVIYDGSYYDVTKFISEHDGGAGAFTEATCGNDITNYLSGATNSGTDVKKNKHSSSAYSILETYKVGPVAQQ